MPRVKVIYNRQGCIGAAACELAAPEFWKMAQDAKADLLGAKLNPDTGKYELEIEVSDRQLRALKESAESCPVQVIEIVEQV
jgi:ferredoxin